MNAEHRAAELIRALEGVIEDLQAIENGKNYRPDQAREKLYGVLLALQAEGADADNFRKDI